MKPLEPNTAIEVPGLKCPECSGPVNVSIEAWGDDGEPHEVRVECANDEPDDEDGEPCLDCDGSGGDGFDDATDEDTCDTCGGSGSISGHRYFQSDWQEIRDAAEAWVRREGFRVPESSR